MNDCVVQANVQQRQVGSELPRTSNARRIIQQAIAAAKK
jgi:hypothetical protein